MLTGLNCVRKGPSDHGNDVLGFLKMWGISYPAREPTTDQKLCTVYFVRSDFIPRCPLRCGRGHHHTAGEEAQTVRNLTCSRRCQVRISALTGTNPTDGMAFVSSIQANSSHDSLLSRHLLQSVLCELVGQSLINYEWRRV